VEYETVFHRLLGCLQLLVGDLGGSNAVDLLFDSGEGFGGGERLGAAGNLKQSGVVEVRSPGRRDTVGVSQFCANALEQAAGKSPSEDIAHHFEGWKILVFEDAAEVAHIKESLGDIVFD